MALSLYLRVLQHVHATRARNTCTQHVHATRARNTCTQHVHATRARNTCTQHVHAKRECVFKRIQENPSEAAEFEHKLQTLLNTCLQSQSSSQRVKREYGHCTMYYVPLIAILLSGRCSRSGVGYQRSWQSSPST